MDASRGEDARSARRELTLSRTFEASRRLVFRAWTDQKRLARWWGPRGFDNPVCEFEARAAGAIRIDMRGPDGTVYSMTGVVREIVEPERLVFACMPLDENRRPLFEVVNTVAFAEHKGMTTVTVHARVVRATPAAVPYLAGMEPGWSQSLDRLGALLGSRPAAGADGKGISRAGDREIVISRVLDAPREMVWDAWTDPEQVVRWWGPRGFSTTIDTMDVRPGGIWKHVMHGPDGGDYPNKSVFTDVVEPERIAYNHGGGREGRKGVSFKATWTFEALNRHETRVTMRSVFPSAEDRERVVREYGALEGGEQTLERLAEHLRTRA